MLAVAASLVLLIGLWVRSRLERDDRATPAAPLSEAAPLQQLSQEGQIRRVSSFVTERTERIAPFVRYVARTGASGIRWRADTLLSIGSDGMIDVSRVARADSSSPPIRILDDSTRNDWLLVAARAADGALLSVTGALGGRARVGCAGRELTEMVLDVPLSPHLAGGGVFDLDGRLVGMVARCEGRVIALPTRQLTVMFARRDSASARRAPFGMEVATLDSAMRAHFHSDSGVLVVAIRRGSAAAAAGLRPGDVLLRVDGRPVAAPSDLAARTDSSATRVFARLRGAKRDLVRVTAIDSASERGEATLGIGVSASSPARGVPVLSVTSGSIAQRAGLRPGDRLIRIGDADVSSVERAERLLRAVAADPVFVVFERDSIQRGILISR